MTRFIKLLPVIIPLVIYAAYLHLDFFYGMFGIDIKQWVELDELLILFFSDLEDYCLYVVVFLTGAYLILRAREYFLLGLNDRISTRRKYKIKFLINFALPMVLLFLVYRMIFQLESEEYERYLNSILCIVFLIPMLIIVWAKEMIENIFNVRLTKVYVLTFILAVTLLSHSYVNAGKNAKKIYNSKNYTSIYITENRHLDSLIYLGRTRNYYLFLDKKQHNGIVIGKETLLSMEINSPVVGKVFNLYE